MQRPATTDSNGGIRRFATDFPCPICGGHPYLPRGHGRRCWGYLSSDGRFAHCVRPEHAGPIPPHGDSGTYPHRLDRPCDCGQMHTGAMGRPAARRSNAKKIWPQDAVDKVIQVAEATYRYESAAGELLCYVLRYPFGHDSQKALPLQRTAEGWVSSWPRRCPLYNLPAVTKAITAGEPIWIVEGEKAAEALIQLGAVATTNPMGAGKWRPWHTKALRGAKACLVWPDDDPPGREHAKAIAAGLAAAGIECRLIEPAEIS